MLLLATCVETLERTATAVVVKWPCCFLHVSYTEIVVRKQQEILNPVCLRQAFVKHHYDEQAAGKSSFHCQNHVMHLYCTDAYVSSRLFPFHWAKNVCKCVLCCTVSDVHTVAHKCVNIWTHKHKRTHIRMRTHMQI